MNIILTRGPNTMEFLELISSPQPHPIVFCVQVISKVKVFSMHQFYWSQINYYDILFHTGS